MRRLSVVLLAVLVMLGMTLAPAGAGKQLPVPYSFLPNALFGGSPEADAPGTNDFSCKPTAAHPRPVVLVHGTMGNRATNWQTYGPLLKNNGYCVFALTYGAVPGAPFPVSALGGMNRMESSAAELKAFVARVLKATGARQVDLIGHSQGTLMPNYWLKFLGGAGKVHTYISLAPLWHGTGIAQTPAPFAAYAPADFTLPFCEACTQMGTGSAFLKKMRAGGVAVPGVRYVNIMTKYDQLVIPYTSGSEAGMKNIVLQDRCAQDYSEHFEIAADRNATVLVLNSLDPAHPRRLVCSSVLPFVGGL